MNFFQSTNIPIRLLVSLIYDINSENSFPSDNNFGIKQLQLLSVLQNFHLCLNILVNLNVTAYQEIF